MDLETLRSICTAFPGVTEDIKWEDHLCFNVGGKMFLITSPDHHPISVSIKCSDEDFEVMSARPGCRPAAYLARHKWVYISDISLVEPSEWQRLCRQAYELVRDKLPKRVIQSLQ
ncbi:MAG: MmcQ/YjbR family DNA-binding protein [Bacteroidia bacterium]